MQIYISHHVFDYFINVKEEWKPEQRRGRGDGEERQGPQQDLRLLRQRQLAHPGRPRQQEKGVHSRPLR